MTQSKTLDTDDALRKLGIEFPESIKKKLFSDIEPMDEFNIKEFVEEILSQNKSSDKKTFKKIKKSGKRISKMKT